MQRRGPLPFCLRIGHPQSLTACPLRPWLAWTVRTTARFPAVPPDRGHYESIYLKASAPEGGRAIWIRHTFHRRPGAPATGAVWLTYFDAERRRPRAMKRQVGEQEVSVPEGAYLRVDGAEIGPGWAQGEVALGDSAASWNLRFSDRHAALHHLPAEWMYRSRLPRTKLLSPHPGAVFDGIVEIDGERLEIEAWPGMVGHNWGSEHAETWVWIHGTGLGGPGSRDYFDLAAGRVRVGPVLTPWAANGQLVLAGETIRLGGLGSLRSTSIEAEPTSCRFSVPGKGGVTVRGSVGAPADRFVGWLYSNPGGGEHHALNCSISDLRLTLERAGGETTELALDGAAAYELGTEATDHGIPIEPFPDG